MDRNQQIPLGRRLAAVLVILGLFLVSLAAVSPLTHHHQHGNPAWADHAHAGCGHHHHAHTEAAATSAPVNSAALPAPQDDEAACGFCVLLMGAPAPLAIDLPTVGRPTRIAWVKGFSSPPVSCCHLSNPSGRGPPI